MYVETSLQALNHSLASAREGIIAMAGQVAAIMEKKGVIQLFGVGQDEAFGMELGYRAGGLVQYHRLNLRDLLMRGVVEAGTFNHPDFAERPELAQRLWDLYTIDPQDGILIYASDKVHAITLALAELAKSKGHVVMLVYNAKSYAANKDSSNHEALLSISDIALDLDVPFPDLVCDVEGYRYGQVTNLVGNMFAQAMTMEIYRILTAAGYHVPVLQSANIKGADEHNKQITAPFDGRWNS